MRPGWGVKTCLAGCRSADCRFLSSHLNAHSSCGPYDLTSCSSSASESRYRLVSLRLMPKISHACAICMENGSLLLSRLRMLRCDKPWVTDLALLAFNLPFYDCLFYDLYLRLDSHNLLICKKLFSVWGPYGSLDWLCKTAQKSKFPRPRGTQNLVGKMCSSSILEEYNVGNKRQVLV